MKNKNQHIGGQQLLLITPQSDWQIPARLPDLTGIDTIALDTENRDDGLANGRGPGWAIGAGYVCGISIAWHNDKYHSCYIPIKHPESNCFSKEQVGEWLKYHMHRGMKFIFHGAPYDIGWINHEWKLPPNYDIHDTGCMAYMIDENRLSYSLNSLCSWRKVPGKNEKLLREAASAYGYDAKSDLWRLPARYVGPYAEQDALSTLMLAESLERDLEPVKEAYRLEMDLVPMVHEMRRRGIRISPEATEQAYYKFKNISALALQELSTNLNRNVSIEDIRSAKWLETAFTDQQIPFPLTIKTGRGSFEAKWMRNYNHWLPKLIVRAKQFEDAAEKFIKTYIMDFTHKGRLHASIHQYRAENLSDEEKHGGGTRTYRFSYSDPPLQQTPHRNDDMALDIRKCFIPEKREKWLRADYSQQEFRLMVHFAESMRLSKSTEAADRYRNDPDTDFHQMVADMTGLPRKPAKDCNFAKAYGAGKRKFAMMIGKSEDDAHRIMVQYDEKLPFVKQLYDFCQQTAQNRGYIKLLDGARIHFDWWVAKWRDENVQWTNDNHMADCRREEAERRIADPNHPWHGKTLRRSRCNKAMNSLIQGGAARQTKLAMRECWQAGIVPLLQLHDELNFSLADKKTGQQISELMCNAVQLRIPMKVDLEYGSSWAG